MLLRGHNRVGHKPIHFLIEPSDKQPSSLLTSSPLLHLLLLAEFVQRQVGHVQAVDRARQHGRERVHDGGPLRHQLLPAGQGGQHRQQLVPQVPGDVDVQVGSDPGDDDGLEGERGNRGEPAAIVIQRRNQRDDRCQRRTLKRIDERLSAKLSLFWLSCGRFITASVTLRRTCSSCSLQNARKHTATISEHS